MCVPAATAWKNVADALAPTPPEATDACGKKSTIALWTVPSTLGVMSHRVFVVPVKLAQLNDMLMSRPPAVGATTPVSRLLVTVAVAFTNGSALIARVRALGARPPSASAFVAVVAVPLRLPVNDVAVTFPLMV